MVVFVSKEEQLLEILDYVKHVLLEAKNQDRIVSKIRLLADIQMKYGRTKRRSIEYLQTLIDGDVIRIEGDEVWLKGL